MEWLEPGIMIGMAGILLAFVGKVTSNIDSIKRGAVAGADLNNSLKNMQGQLGNLKTEVDDIKKIITNGLSSKVNKMTTEVSKLETAQTTLTETLNKSVKELAEVKARCEERTRWVEPRNEGRREGDHYHG